jgi:hypothetical protein
LIGRDRSPCHGWGGLAFYASEDMTLTFRRANGDSGPVIEARLDDGGNLYILKKQP